MACTFIISFITILLLHLLSYPTLSSQLGHKLVKRPSSHSGSEVGQQISSGASDTSSGDSSELLLPQDPVCSSSGFGYFPNAVGCGLALNEMPIRASEFATPFQFGPVGSAGTDVETPRYFAVNLCVIAVSNSPDINTPDDGLWQAIYAAAASIIEKCVTAEQVGGHVSGEGFNGNIGVTIFSRRPQTGKDVYKSATELEDDIKHGIQNPEPESNTGQAGQQQQDTATSEGPAAKKQKTCQAGESGYVKDAGGCCKGFAYTKQTFSNAAVQFGIKVGQAILEAGICLIGKP
ncbi:MAG: hypothetical protein M1812_005158 [Candelaria pacifica]|nr:MAG: hypothetical protein M1812_005158 [Candelaria pacifica]